MNKSLSIILPVYNEQENIVNVVSSLDKVIKLMDIDYEIIIIESGSTDNTKAVIGKLFKKYKNIKIYYQNAKKGYGNALREGFTKAKKEFTLCIDSDSPFDFNELKNLIPKIQGYDVLIGYRTGKRESFKRYFFSFGYSLVTKFLLGLKGIKDVNFSFKLIKTNILKNLDLISNGWFIDAEILTELQKKSVKINQIPILYTPREKGKSNVSVFKTALGLIKELHQYKKHQKLYK